MAGPANKSEERELPSLFTEKFFQFLAFLLLFIALLWGQNHLIYLSLLLLAMVNGAKLWCRLSARGINAVLEIDRRKAFPGEKILLCCRVQSSSLLPVWLQLEIPLDRGFFIFPGENSLRGNGGLMWREKGTWDWELAAPGRGIYRVGPLGLVSADLLGFFQQRKDVGTVRWLIVFPRIIPLKPFSVPLEEFFGEQKGKSPAEDPVYPIATRDYRLGRPARHIHWKASLHHNCLQEKVFEHTLRKKILLIIDVGQFEKQEDGEGFEAALEVAASLAVQLDAQGCSTGLITNGLTSLPGGSLLPLSRGGEHLQALLGMLAALRLRAVKPLPGMLRSSPGLLRGGMVMCFAHHGNGEPVQCAEIFLLNRVPAVFVLKETREDYLEKTGHRILNLGKIHGGGAGA